MKKSFIEVYGSMFTAGITAVVAFAIAIWGHQLSMIFRKSNLDIKGKCREFKQAGNRHVWRVAIKNYGNKIAKNVQAEVIEILDEGKSRKNFISMQLRWTNRQKAEKGELIYYESTRDILPHQTAFLDIADDDHLSNQQVNLASIVETPDIPDYYFFKKGESKLKILVTQEEGKHLDFDVTI